MNPSLAAKALIVRNKKILLIKRRANDVHKPGAWEIPGGRIELGKDPYEELKREVREETGLEVKVLAPLSVNYFTREDGQTITSIVFLCSAKEEKILLSEEHTQHLWLEASEAKKIIYPAFVKEINKAEEEHLIEKAEQMKAPQYKLK